MPLAQFFICHDVDLFAFVTTWLILHWSR